MIGSSSKRLPAVVRKRSALLPLAVVGMVSIFCVVQRYEAAKFGLPDLRDHDEYAIAGQAARYFREGRWLPYEDQNAFLYASGQTYLVLGEVKLSHFLGSLTGRAREHTRYPTALFVLLSRYTSLVAFLGDLWVLYLIGTKSSDQWGGMMAALFFASVSTVTTSSVAGKSDAVAVFFCLLAFFSAQLWLEKRHKRFLMACCVFAAMGAKFKLTAWPGMLFAPGAVIAGWLHHLWQMKRIQDTVPSVKWGVRRVLLALVAVLLFEVLVSLLMQPSLVLRYQLWRSSLDFVLQSSDPHQQSVPFMQRIPLFVSDLRKEMPLVLLVLALIGFLTCCVRKEIWKKWTTGGFLIVLLAVLLLGVVRLRYGVAAIAFVCVFLGVFVSGVLTKLPQGHIRVGLAIAVVLAAGIFAFRRSNSTIASSLDPQSYTEQIVASQEWMCKSADFGTTVMMEDWGPLTLPDVFFQLLRGNYSRAFVENSGFEYYVEWLSSRPAGDGLREQAADKHRWLEESCDTSITMRSTGRTPRARVFKRRDVPPCAEACVPYRSLQHQVQKDRESPILNRSFEDETSLFSDWSIGCDLKGRRIVTRGVGSRKVWVFEGFGDVYLWNVTAEESRGPYAGESALKLTGKDRGGHGDVVLISRDRTIAQIYSGAKALVAELYCAGSYRNERFTLFTFSAQGMTPERAIPVKTPWWERYHVRQFMGEEPRDVRFLIRLYGRDMITLQLAKISVERLAGDPEPQIDATDASHGSRSLRLTVHGRKEKEYARQYLPLSSLPPNARLRLRAKVPSGNPFRDVEFGVRIVTISWGGEYVKERECVLLRWSQSSERAEDWQSYDIPLSTSMSSWLSGPSSLAWLRLEIFLRSAGESGTGSVLVDELEIY